MTNFHKLIRSRGHSGRVNYNIWGGRWMKLLQICSIVERRLFLVVEFSSRMRARQFPSSPAISKIKLENWTQFTSMHEVTLTQKSYFSNMSIRNWFSCLFTVVTTLIELFRLQFFSFLQFVVNSAIFIWHHIKNAMSLCADTHRTHIIGNNSIQSNLAAYHRASFTFLLTF